MWVTLAIVVVLLTLIWSLTGRPKGLPPGPTCYPIIGNVGLFKPSEALKAHRRLRKIYGDIFTIMIFHKPIIFVHGFDNIRALLVKHGDIFSDRPRMLSTDIAEGNGVIWSWGPLWKETRSFSVMTLRKFGFGKRSMESQIMEEVDCLIEKLGKSENEAFDIKNLLNASTANVICSLLFDKNLNQTLEDIIQAGTETSSTTLRWALLFLIHYPHWQKRIQKEIDYVIGQGQPKMEHKEQLPTVEAFMLESIRVGNTSPLTAPRAAKEDFTYKGHLFPKGTTVLFLLESALMDPETFPEPSKFKPERFLDDNGRCREDLKDKLISFSVGPRACLGEALAKMELFLFFVRFLQKFQIKPEDPQCLPPIEGSLGITHTPNAFNLRLVKR
ncbi:cytochrome P450 2C37-like isoform X6 [Saccostrea cucullata]|uniref:cytochrome P450 2C37-like isoform X6 n=1 Tax=Saccostrea cuccullata TaxID=36930 RepID=UPI002ECFD3F6